MGRIDGIHDDSPQFARGFYASRDTFGMRANAVASAVRANPSDPYTYPVIGLNFVQGLHEYRDRDSVGFYADNTSPPFKSWEIIKYATYTPTSFSSISIDASKIKPGMIIDTMHNPKWSTYVVRVSEKKVITSGWVNAKTGSLGTPENGIGLTINPITKVWAVNFNALLPSTGRADKLTIQENGIINNKVENPPAVNGVDTVILPQSKFGGTIAYWARSATSGFKKQWNVGFMANGSKTANFFSANGVKDNNTDTGFLENSTADNGMVFSGANKKSAVEFRYLGKVTTKLSPDGKIEKIAYKTKIITQTSKLTDDYARYIIKATSDISIILPNAENLPDGYTLEIYNFTGHSVNFSGKEKITNAKTLSTRMTAIFVDGEWQIL
ncbi:hypothetical protein D9980_03310 [Serratia sp. 3ACOL1]|nr:hypothetical protein D9980_03310 [Serratia sp. 3ACOL1]